MKKFFAILVLVVCTTAIGSALDNTRVAAVGSDRTISRGLAVTEKGGSAGQGQNSMAMPCPGNINVNLASGECGKTIEQFGFGFPDIDVQNLSIFPNNNTDEVGATLYCPSGQTVYRRTFFHAGPTDMNIVSLYLGVYEAYNNPLVTFNFYSIGGQKLGTHTTYVPDMNQSVLFVPLPVDQRVHIPASSQYIMEVVTNAPYISVFKIGRNDDGNAAGYSEASVSAPDCPSGGFQEEGPGGYNANSIVFGARAIPEDYRNINTSNGYREGDFFPIGQHLMNYIVVDAAGNSTACSFTIQVNEFSGASGVMACNDQVNVALNDECSTAVTPGMVLEGEQYGCFDDYEVDIFGASGNNLGNVVTSSLSGQTLQYQVTGPNGNRCWGEILVEDKLPPQLECHDVYATCTTDLTPGSLISPRVPVAAYIENGTLDAQEPSVTTFDIDVAHLMGSTIQDLNIYLDITHGRVSDLSAHITSPDGVTVPLFFGLNCTGQNLMVTLDQTAAGTFADLQNTCDPADAAIAGSFQPFQSLNVFNGKPLEGTWRVTIFDHQSGQGGKVNQVHLIFIQQGAYVPFPVAGPVTHTNLNNNTFVVYGADNCGPATLSYTDQIVQEDCASVYSKIIKRCWKGLDPKGNIAEPCCQYIYVYRNSLATLQFPPNYDGLPGHEEALSCFDFGTAIPGTDVTGKPTGDLCASVQILEPVDVKIDICDKSYKLLRTHKVLEWCSGQVIVHNQIIKVLDNKGPELSCPEDVTISTDDHDCFARYVVPLPQIDSECSDEVTYFMSYNYLNDNTDEFEDVNADQESRVVKGLVQGENRIRWHVTDACGNSSECRFSVTVEDKVLPNAVCDQVTVASLTGNGKAKVEALTFDDQSTDNCGVFGFAVRKMTEACGIRNTEFAPFVEFCCEEVNTVVMVELLVTDVNGNTNSCMVEVHVQDKLPPYITKCPSDITLDCKADYNNLDITGRPAYIDNCGVVEVTSKDASNINQCGVGLVSRTWTVKDAQGYTHACVQRITLFDNDPFTVNQNDPADPDDDIVWPAHYETEECHASLQPGDLPAGYDKPVVVSDPCSIIAMHHKDQVFKLVDGACEKIIRTWTVIDWCTYNENNPVPGRGLYVYNQIIKLQNKTAPVFTEGCNDRTFSTFGECKGLVEYSPVVTDDCTENPADFIWKYELYNAAGTSLILTGSTGTFSHELANGKYLIKWTVEDRCGNRSYCSYTITVTDGKKPSPYCLSSLATAVMNSNGTIAIWAKDFDRGAFDNCTPTNKLTFTFFGALPVETKRNEIHYFKGNGELATEAEYLDGLAQKWLPQFNTSGLLFGCADIPNGISQQIAVDVSVTDLSGNQDYCTVNLLLQDNTNFCPDNTSMFSISGKALYGTLPVEGVEVVLTSTLPEQNKTSRTSTTGAFMFQALPGGFQYGLSMSDQRGLLNGISTLDLVMIQRHILGLDVFTDPRKVIAADVDNNGRVSSSDLIALRKGILGIATEFPNGQHSWRFIRSDYKFPDLNQPFPYGEKYEYQSLNENKTNQNFYAIKIGDVNQSATVNPDDSSTEIRSSRPLVLEVDHVSGKRGDLIRVPVMNAKGVDVYGFQYTLTFDPSVLTFEALEGGKFVGEQNMGLHLTDQGLITTAWHHQTPVYLEEGEELFTIVFRLNKELEQIVPVGINSKVTPAAAYTSDMEGLPVVLVARNSHVPKGPAILGSQPNPFTSQAVLTVQVAESSDVELTLTDVTGKVLQKRELHLEQGVHQLDVDLSGSAYTGMILCTMRTGQWTATQRIVRIR